MKILLLLVAIVASQYCIGQDSMWGMTSGGGRDGLGVIFKTDANGLNPSAEMAFTSEAPGAVPLNTTLCPLNGKLYGLTSEGGSHNRGVIFEFDPASSVYKPLQSFQGPNGSAPRGSLIVGANGKLYGMTSAGGNTDDGVLFEYDLSTNELNKKFDFSSTQGAIPHGSLTLSSTGSLLGLTYSGGENGRGVLFEYNPITNDYVILHQFEILSGGHPKGDLLLTNGKLYGLTYMGGLNGKGVIFQFDLSTKDYSAIQEFGGDIGEYPEGSLIQASNGLLYGNTQAGGDSGNGVLFEFNPELGVASKMYDYTYSTGYNAIGKLTEAQPGKLIGLARSGVIYEYDLLSGIYSAKINLNNVAGGGSAPLGGLILHTDNKYYGLTSAGGSENAGVIFEYQLSSNTYNKLLDFNRIINGGGPRSKLVQAETGKLYGMTPKGGAHGLGTIFEFDPYTREFHKKIDFDGLNGQAPNGGFILASNKKLYGLTRTSLSYPGALIEYSPYENTVVVRHFFDGLFTGAGPNANLIESENGKLYGMTRQGGVYNRGVIFVFDPNTNSLEKLYDFNPTDEGHAPLASLVEFNGILYGTTNGGGSFNLGIIFSFDPDTKAFQKLFDFDITTGYAPQSSLTNVNGKLYGTTSAGPGFLFEFDPSNNALQNKVEFNGVNGYQPSGDLYLSPNGKLYGTTQYGGVNNRGVLFEFNPENGAFEKKIDFDGLIGSYPTAAGLTLVKSRQDQEISFATIGDKTMGDPPFTINATSSSSLGVSFFTTSNKIELNNNEAKILFPGRASITAKQEGNIDFNPAQDVTQDFCINPEKPVVTLDNTSVLHPVLISSSSHSNQWYKDGVIISGAASQNYTVNSSGIYYVVVSIEGCTNQSNDQPVIITGIEDRTAHQLNISPNPADQRVTITLPGSSHKALKIFSIAGKAMYNQSHSLNEVTIDINSYPAGYYITIVSTDAGFYYGRFVKK
ncbi:MAG TPA: T9SS type A sorting domain-containing protein [Tenuifilaceae bacterium]|nr:T9SS type A sorting domain-containing protein [Saprospiraceae bacterium]HNS31067.1 T9SS type A sorting domain-containing protein [Tenuifilaceae bacterium]